MAILVDWAKQTVSGTPGTGTITLSTAVTGFIRLQDDTRLADGATVYYTIEDGSNFERGIGTYTATGTTLARTLIQAKYESGTYSENPGTGLTLTSAAIVSCSAVAATHNFRGCCVYKAATQSISNTTDTLLQFDTEFYDTDGFFNSGTSTTKIIIPSGRGIKKVELFGNMYFAAAANGLRMGRLYKNGALPTDAPGFHALFPVGATSTEVSVNFRSGIMNCADADEFTFSAYQTSGGAVNVGGAGLGSIHYFGLRVIE